MTPAPDDDLRRLIHHAVDDTEPGDRWGVIHDRTRASAPGPWRRRTAIGGAVLATAAAVGAVAVLPGLLTDPETPPVAGVSTPSATASPDPSTSPTSPTGQEPENPQSVPAYFIGDGPAGEVLYREFVVTDGTTPRLLAALRALEGTPGDPDYRTAWTPGSFVGASYSPAEGLITVEVAGTVEFSGSYGSPDDSADPLAVQQLVYTAQGAVGEGRVPVLIEPADGSQNPGSGLSDEPITNAPVLDTLSLMSISYPFQGAQVQGSFTATGVNNSFEATVVWRLESTDGEVVRRGFSTAEGWGEERLYPWEAEIDVSGLPAGDYTFVAENDDPTGGTEGNGPDSDTRLVVIE